MTLGFDKQLYILPFDHHGTFQTTMFDWEGMLTAAQTAEIAAAKQVIYDGFKATIAAGVLKDKAGVLVDEQFGAAPGEEMVGQATEMVASRHPRADEMDAYERVL